MTGVDNILGNIYIKHNDKWRGDYYLTSDLTFSLNKEHAERFYLLKSGDTTIDNGDRISIHNGNRTLVTDNMNNVKLMDREQIQKEIHTFIITNGTNNTDAISYETPIFLISNKTQKMALKYEWGMDLINSRNTENNITTYKPHDNPNLINSNYNNICESSINLFQFYLERTDNLIKNVETVRTSARKNELNLLGVDKSTLIVILLIVILVLCIILIK